MWDFELLKEMAVFLGSKSQIVAIEFIEKFPLLVSVSQDGIIAIYTVRGCPRLLRSQNIARLLNVSYDGDAYVNSAITGMTYEVVPNPRFDPGERQYGELAKNIQYFTKVKHTYLSSDRERDVNWFTKSVFLSRLENEIEEYQTSFKEDDSALRANKTFKTQEQDKDDSETSKFHTSDYADLFPKFYPPFDNRENPEFLNLIITDESGCIKWLDLTTFIRDPQTKLTESDLIRTLKSD